jgi:hypothetical protein
MELALAFERSKAIERLERLERASAEDRLNFELLNF